MYVVPLNKLTKKDVGVSGGKGASLGEMMNNGFPVPNGFVVTSETFYFFVKEFGLQKEIDKLINSVNYNHFSSIEKVSSKIRDLFKKTSIPVKLEKEIINKFRRLNTSFVAVRSSATAEDSVSLSWAGELESYLNTSEKNLILNIKKCWSSLFTPRAIKYCKENNVSSGKIGVAVVVQEMVEAEIAGVCFTVHPVTKNKNELHIEAALGLGEAVVSGVITPDSYNINKKELVIEEINIGRQKTKLVRVKNGATKWIKVKKSQQETQKLTGKKIIELVKMCINIERHYKKPQDIEWTYRKDKFFIVQSRPITTI